MSNINISGRLIGPEHPPFIIPEVGINHEGNISKAIECVDAAVDSGAEVIKFQCHITEKEMIPTDMTPGEISSEKLWDIIKRCELTEDEEYQLQSYCKEKNIIFLSTPFSREAADRLLKMGVPGFKIGSGECNNFPLIDYVASMGKPMIVSTGMNNLESIIRTVKIIKKYNTPFALMHCTSMYPTPYRDVRLGAIGELYEAFTGVPIGLSDHSINIWTSIASVALGACIIEKHFTISRAWPGPDVPISIEPQELHQLIEGANSVWEARGGAKNVLPGEEPVIGFAYATVVSILPITKGDRFTLENTWVKRPGNGALLADRLEDIIGLRAARDILPDQHISPSDIQGFE